MTGPDTDRYARQAILPHNVPFTLLGLLYGEGDMEKTGATVAL